MKTEYVLKNDMIIWRIHDRMHAMRPDYTVVGSLRSIGVKGGEESVMRPRVLTIPETSFGEFASQVKRSTGSRVKYTWIWDVLRFAQMSDFGAKVNLAGHI